MYKKLFSTSIINAATAGLNIFSSFIIVKLMSLQVFGEFAIFNSILAFGGLIYAVIPSNYSIFKLQDDLKFKPVLLSFFILSSVAFLFFVFLMKTSGIIKIDFLTVYLFGVSTFFLGYFDIKFQAMGYLSKYFIMLFISAILKIMTLIAFYFFDCLQNLSDLIWSVTLAQLLLLIIFLFEDRADLRLIFKDFNVYKEAILSIKYNFSTFTPYYLNTCLKRVRENVIVLLFGKFMPKETIGLFSIFVKITSFVFGLSRTLEAFFMNRENIYKYREAFNQKILYFAISLQFIFLCVGLVYLKMFVDRYFFIEILILSCLVYPHVFFLLARSEMLSNYRNIEANVSEILYILIVFVGVSISYICELNSIYPILITFMLSTFGLQIFMIFSKKNNNYNV